MRHGRVPEHGKGIRARVRAPGSRTGSVHQGIRVRVRVRVRYSPRDRARRRAMRKGIGVRIRIRVGVWR